VGFNIPGLGFRKHSKKNIYHVSSGQISHRMFINLQTNRSAITPPGDAASSTAEVTSLLTSSLIIDPSTRRIVMNDDIKAHINPGSRGSSKQLNINASIRTVIS